MAKIKSFNSLSRFIAYSIVSMRSMKDRVKVLKNHIRLAHCLVSGALAGHDANILSWGAAGNGLGSSRNFDSAMAIVSALQGASVSRLKLTWKDISQKHKHMYEDLCELLSPRSNYKNLRAAVKDSLRVPCVPYLGIYLQDLTFIADGNPAILQQPPPRLPNIDSNLIWIPTHHSSISRNDGRGSVSSVSSISSTISAASYTVWNAQGQSTSVGRSRQGSIRMVRKRPSLIGSGIVAPSIHEEDSSHSLINFERCWLLAKVVQDFRSRQASCLQLLEAHRVTVDENVRSTLSFYREHVDSFGRFKVDFSKLSKRSRVSFSEWSPTSPTSTPTRSRQASARQGSNQSSDLAMLYASMLGMGDIAPSDGDLFQMSLECEPRQKPTSRPGISNITPSSSPPMTSPLASPPASPILKTNSGAFGARRWGGGSPATFDFNTSSPSRGPNSTQTSSSQNYMASPSQVAPYSPIPISAAFGRRWSAASAIVLPPGMNSSALSDSEGDLQKPNGGSPWRHLRVRSSSPPNSSDRRRISLF
ncbi:hypothetical protein HDU97_007523 [Phlyctochytrium planicorne]|nr:hypothetical protein HDU97_007523 [Phlyctochytrium planicorne]